MLFLQSPTYRVSCQRQHRISRTATRVLKTRKQIWKSTGLTTHLFITDPHAHYQHDNKRAEYLGHLINNTKPDTVIFGGDIWDMPSLSAYDKGKRSFQGRTYRADIDSGLDFLDRTFSIVKAQKKRQPRWVFLEGNHEYRIKKAINLSPELDGAISFNDLNLDYFFNEVVEYEGGTPGVTEIDGIHYAHYFISGVMGRPISGEHPAHSLVSKQSASCSAGHIHTADYHIRTAADGSKLHGLLGGCFQDYDSDWAGKANRLWWRGCVLKRGVDNGNYAPQFITIEELKKEYE